ncbi:unnamed protein product [Didymodactylos carnosus]|uniref:RRM domain-containing protein n=1 Tax=Didymodactylos carnosus TaxID=1234261 RepID=A0A814ELD3_9BILA|nr:unnamed protein product [Didymodactylos carnosus]CAF0971037.1 unnamed protein product [Didymodactylos carnosus]CAF3574920.1 unnamed protein product [Didymodactylos carnosus]CAF3744092.1 unnamed protein product [Didymodactylos carnosus]
MPRRSHTRSHSKSISRSPSRSRSRTRSPPHSRSHYRSSYHQHRSHHNHDHGYPPPASHYRGYDGGEKRIYRSRSRSGSSSKRYVDDIERLNPPANKVLGVFGLGLNTDERDLRKMYEKFGRVEDVRIVYDRRTGRSRGFGFVYFDRVDDAKEAKKETHGLDIDGQKIRVDYSLTEKAHAPTPGIYMGARYYGSSGSGGSRNGYGSHRGSGSRRRTPSYEKYSRSRSRK